MKNFYGNYKALDNLIYQMLELLGIRDADETCQTFVHWLIKQVKDGKIDIKKYREGKL